jgi:hypothetical protein
MALRSISQNGNGLVLQERQVGIVVVVDFGGHAFSFEKVWDKSES